MNKIDSRLVNVIMQPLMLFRHCKVEGELSFSRLTGRCGRNLGSAAEKRLARVVDSSDSLSSSLLHRFNRGSCGPKGYSTSLNDIHGF